VVFVSYAHEDENFLIRLRAFLKPLEGRRSTANARRVEVFDDTAIRPGAAWRMELEHEVERADVAILLVSQYLVASDFVREYEIPWILSQSQTRDLLVVCVPVGTAFGYPKELDEFQWVGDPERPMEALVPYEQNTIWKQVAETVAERAQADHPAAGSRG
jgi:hypothetical protein